MEITLLFIGVILLSIGIVKNKKASFLLLNGKKARAIVYRIETDISQKFDYPVIRFKTEDKTWVTTKLQWSITSVSEGDHLDVLYNPENPEYVMISSNLFLNVLPKLFISTGLVFLILSVLMFFDIIQIS